MPERPVPQIIYDESLSGFAGKIEVDLDNASRVLALVGFPDEDISITRIVLQEKYSPYEAYIDDRARVTREIYFNIFRIHPKNRLKDFAHEAQHLYDVVFEPEVAQRSQKLKNGLLIGGGLLGFSTSMFLAISDITRSGDASLAPLYCLITPLFTSYCAVLGKGIDDLISPLEERARRTAKQIVTSHPELKGVITIKPK